MTPVPRVRRAPRFTGQKKKKKVSDAFFVPPIGTAPRPFHFFFATSELSFGGVVSFVNAPIGTAPSNLTYTSFYPEVPFDYLIRLVDRESTAGWCRPPGIPLGLGMLSGDTPVCCGCAVRVEPRSGPLGQDGIDYFFFTIAPYGAFIGPCVYLKVHQRAVPP